MVDNENKNPNNNQEASDADLQWQEFSQLRPERDDVVLPETDDEDGGGDGSLSENMAKHPKLSDFQTLMKQLFPTFKTEWLTYLQTSRVFADVFPHLLNIFVKSLMSENPNMSLGEATAQVYSVLSVAVDGTGRFDAIAAYIGGMSEDSEDGKKLMGS